MIAKLEPTHMPTWRLELTLTEDELLDVHRALCFAGVNPPPAVQKLKALFGQRYEEEGPTYEVG